VGDVIPFRPLAWVLDLDVRGDQARTVAEVLAWMSRPKRRPTYRLVALRCRIVAACRSPLRKPFIPGESGLPSGLFLPTTVSTNLFSREAK